MRDLNREGLTCVLVEQNVAVSLKLASRAYVLENGRITLSGSGAALLVDDRVRQAYLGLAMTRAVPGRGAARTFRNKNADRADGSGHAAGCKCNN